jgi:4-aminobutyrate aminotransferase-like enzyme
VSLNLLRRSVETALEPATAFTADVVNGLRKRGILTGSTGPDANILKLRPPMVFSKQNADYMFGILDETLSNP